MSTHPNLSAQYNPESDSTTFSSPEAAPKWQAFMFHLPPDLSEYIRDLLHEYDTGQYLIAHEATPYSHYHIVAQISDRDYHKLAKRIIEKHNLRGRAISNKPRQYGKLKKINDLERLLIYTCKDQNVIGNFSEAEIKKYIERSFKKDDKQKFFIDLQQYIDADSTWRGSYKPNVRFNTPDGLVYNADLIKIKIAQFYRDKELALGHSQLEAQFLAYTQHKKSKWVMTLDEQMDYYKYRFK